MRDWLNERNEKFFADGTNQNAMIPIRNEGKKGYTSEDLIKILEYFKQVLDAVEYCESREEIYLNLKPENILYDKSKDSFLISDFDVGQVYYSIQSLTHTRTTLYAVPGRHTTRASDHYSLGIILFEILFPLQNEYDSLEEKLCFLKEEDTATACEAMHNSLPDLCSLITRIVRDKGTGLGMTDIIQVVHRGIICPPNRLNFFKMKELLGEYGLGINFSLINSSLISFY